ncbi:GINS complex subunit 4 [Trypanosoma theileri]|uniref:DNA replication complex GINS protein SLD5 n=1 Tax=Trypanosoma theileri TaxID=67003 RepID=A0A1X0PA08_9TRYP|nr:GINS complex subunit 4 [Trypanosoma theileri]ORC93463.1 GINS complex subunit 4 [Trypanosoma theileri]
MFFEDHLDEALSRENSPDGGVSAADPRHSHDTATASSQHGTGTLLAALIQAAENERAAPDILPYPAAIVDGVAAQIAAQNAQIRNANAEEARSSSLLPFRPSDLMALEVQRAQFFLAELLRQRLRKIEALAPAIAYEAQAGIAAPTQLRSLLSHNEVIVADRLAELAGRCAKLAGLQAAPPELQHLVPHPPFAEGDEVLPRPDVDRYVFCVVLDDLGVVRLGDDAVQTVHAGEIFLVPYRSFRPYVLEGRVRLV